MAEYIDRDKVLKTIDDEMSGYYTEEISITDLFDGINKIPIADVVPRSEVEYWEAIAKNNQKWIDKILADKEKVKQELDKFIQEIDQIQKDKADVTYLKEQLIAKAKQEVARQIFEEIEKHLVFNIYGIATISKPDLYELKKKYIGEQR